MSSVKPLKENVIPDRIIDAKDIPSPLPLLRLKRELATMKIEEIVRVDCTDPGCHDDFDSWCTRMFHEFLGEKDNEHYVSYFIKKDDD
ncbi:MAG: sulfurtransferase TusA family protein [Desulfocapsaceae bacterium]|nr:sulfurtransferase TusA family protein [Desulfocapsaceae bacterium]